MSKIKVNKEVRRLLVELDNVFVQYGEIIEKIAERKGDAGENFSVLKLSKDVIIGKAWQIVKASTGKKDVWESYGRNS
jgi:hypothetical protein